MLETAKARGFIGQDAMRMVQVSTLEDLKPAVEAHSVLKWDERLNAICGQTGTVLQDDPSDGTSQVQFPPPLTATAWLPTSALIDINGMMHEMQDSAAGPRMVRVVHERKLRPLVEAHDALKWHDQMGSLCGQLAEVLQVDASDGTSRVFFPPSRIYAWLPTSALLTDLGRFVRVPPVEQLRPAVHSHLALQWNDRLHKICGERGQVLQEDEEDGTTEVVFPIGIKEWLPSEVLIAENEAEEVSSPQAKPAPDPQVDDGGEEPDAKRPRTS